MSAIRNEYLKCYTIVDLNESIAKKVYELKEGRYIKLCDAYKDNVDFNSKKSNFTFAKIWQ